MGQKHSKAVTTAARIPKAADFEAAQDAQVVKDLAALIKSEAKGKLVIVDVRTEEEFKAAHLTDAVNNCVLETAFMGRLEKAIPEKDTPVVFYGQRADTIESRFAALKAVNAGYTRVSDYRGGLEAWRAAGGDCTETAALSADAGVNGDLEVDMKQTMVEWRGRGLAHFHSGTIGLKSGALSFDGQGKLCKGVFVINMLDIKCSDLQGSDYHDVLVSHLQSDDFFHTAEHPEAKFVITSSEVLQGAGASRPNLRIHGQFTLKNVTHPLSIDATTGLNKGSWVAQASFNFDRTLWNVVYGSSRFYYRLAGHLVNDLIDIQLKVVTAAPDPSA